MLVQVTKDVWGVVVWPADTELVFINPFSEPDAEGKPGHGVPAWYAKKFAWSQKSAQIITSKNVKKFLPHLGENMAEGDRVTVDMTFSEPVVE